MGKAFKVVRDHDNDWLFAFGTAFPVGESIPHLAQFYRTDLGRLYRYDAPTLTWNIVAEGGGVGGVIDVMESDGVPTVTSADSLQFDEADGFVVTDLGGGDARVDLAAVPQAAISGLVAALAAKLEAADLAAHEAAADPHTGYQRESEKGAASGYASLDAGTLVPVAQLPAATTAAKGVVELATDGEVAANVAVQGNDARMSNARTPTAHATSHQNGGADEISVAALSGLLADQQAPLAHDIITKHTGFPGGGTNFLREDGTWNLPASAPAPDQEARVLAYLLGGD